jgi:catechol 2,3-dioxygenase-like lactoylglutathione lyase family enzyme
VRVRRTGFVGTRAEDVPATEAFFRNVLGLESLRSDPDWSLLKLPTGSLDLAEVYGAAFDDDRLAPPGVRLFAGFVVDDLDAAHEEMQAAELAPGAIVLAEEAFHDSAYDVA